MREVIIRMLVSAVNKVLVVKLSFLHYFPSYFFINYCKRFSCNNNNNNNNNNNIVRNVVFSCKA